MKKLLLTLLLVATAGTIFAQGKIDTLYYSQDRKCSPHKAFASYYRVALYPTDASLPKQYRDYYITGEVMGNGNFIQIDAADDNKTLFDGECFSYFRSGKKEAVRNYKNGLLNGKFCTYQENGLVKSTGLFLDGKMTGLFTEFLEDGTFVQIEYKDGQPLQDLYVKGDSNGNLTKFRLSNNTPIWETPAVNERKDEYRDGDKWQVYFKNGVKVALTSSPVRDYGKWHRLDIEISNYTISPIEFDPDASITANSTDIKKGTSELKVWSSEEYIKRVDRTQLFATIMMGIAEGLATADAGHSVSASKTYTYSSSSAVPTVSTTYTRTYNAGLAFQSRVLSAYRMADFSHRLAEVQEIKELGYLKKNTINPGESVSGYIHVKRIKGQKVQFTIDIEGAKYVYDWGYGKKCKNKKR